MRKKYFTEEERREAKRAQVRAWQRRNRAHIREYNNTYNRTYRKVNAARISENKRAYHLRKEYNLSQEQVGEMLREQDNRCHLCLRKFTKVRRPRVDHNHRTGRVRKLLCDDCNVGLGRFKDNPRSLRRAACYVERYK